MRLLEQLSKKWVRCEPGTQETWCIDTGVVILHHLESGLPAVTYIVSGDNGLTSNKTVSLTTHLDNSMNLGVSKYAEGTPLVDLTGMPSSDPRLLSYENVHLFYSEETVAQVFGLSYILQTQSAEDAQKEFFENVCQMLEIVNRL